MKQQCSTFFVCVYLMYKSNLSKFTTWARNISVHIVDFFCMNLKPEVVQFNLYNRLDFVLNVSVSSADK